MKQILIVMLFLSCVGKADEVHSGFLDLKRRSVVEWNSFHHSLSNNMSDKSGVWSENGSGRIFTVVDNNGSVTNLKYYVDLFNVSTNVVRTNLVCVSQCFRNDGVYSYTYQTNGVVSMIEVESRTLGDFNVYQVDPIGDLEYYFAATNFVGVHGVRQYQNGAVVREFPPPNEFLRLLRDHP